MLLDRTRSITPLLVSGSVAYPRRMALGGRADGAVHHTGLEKWSCRESNPGPAIPLLGALRA